MYEPLRSLVIYRRLLEDPLLVQLQDALSDEGPEGTCQLAAGLAGPDGIRSIWEALGDCLVDQENLFTLSAERGREEVPAAAVIRELGWLAGAGAAGARRLEEVLGAGSGLDALWRPPGGGFRAGIARALADGDPAALYQAVRLHCGTQGCGRFARHSAFVCDGTLRPVRDPSPVTLDDLIGNTGEKELLRSNTETFLSGRPAHNVLLWGERGSGKSSTIKALRTEYAPQGLKMIQMDREDRAGADSLLDSLRGRGGRYILFLDDLSFEDNDASFKSLKALIQGELEDLPENVRIYATSNRRHLVRETWGDRLDEHGEIHPSDSMQEKLSLADRFGIILRYGRLDRTGYLAMVHEMARRQGLSLSGGELEGAAVQWELSGHGMSGRSAEQLIVSLRMKEEEDGNHGVRGPVPDAGTGG